MSDNKEKKKKGRFSYLNDFKLNDNNEYEYQGSYHYLNLETQDKKVRLNKLSIAYIVLFVLVISGGLIPFEGMINTFYIIIPYVFEIIFVLLLIPCVYKVYRFDTLKHYEYQKTYERIKPYVGIILVNSIIGIIGTIVLYYLKGYSNYLYFFIYLLIKIFTILICRNILKTVDTITYETK